MKFPFEGDENKYRQYTERERESDTFFIPNTFYVNLKYIVTGKRSKKNN